LPELQLRRRRGQPPRRLVHREEVRHNLAPETPEPSTRPYEVRLNELNHTATNQGGRHEHHRPHRYRYPSVPRRHSRRATRRSPPSYYRDTMARQGARHRSVARRSARDVAAARALLVRRVRLAQVRGEAECTAAIRDRDRRTRHPLHSREVTAS